jgi:hypothetical protein
MYEGSYAGAQPAGVQPTEGPTHDGASDDVAAHNKPAIKYSPLDGSSREAGSGSDMNPKS